MWTLFIILAVLLFIIVIGVALTACLRMAGLEDEELMREMEEKSIENADVFVHDEEPTILGIDLAKEEEDKINGLDNN